MASYNLQAYLFRLKNDAHMQAELKTDAAAHLRRQNLDDAEVRALLHKDVAALWEMDVHPLLLVPYSRFVDMPVQEYRERLRPLAGSRRFVS